ncbi:16S rRNA (adenine(1518)-N(6)/adenine(1519)-N(6))-dimethyltransferase RsmA [Limosilactobacillus fastidiosus]|uniref:Ribosomal RNA small subunit methyltransferase A n=1 Tax=Limosilactobacillus fastidiosus TaxID=2759855 RepID=A0A7W3U0C5_9LACO|nr:16S rRNA (adenine(1518)-N(6)/adenine(1519)-N(6))-dimethyltransferase RsmA [Limosilactobacillus fastidiosus]MBB1086604.1 16S rRNA (adenine(1518)-N(6)/adenine(1519)-N(6))-dimethyltransferase RsmA [Limosilactobacillus fastidiosus]MCD7086579.1 16S rRNA (adenine(1518)-N(6)/adenine(1519)-N(6))-dimethyltransferase RsmA [Limosilactobacillus fastidiosus]MCD7115287.1 16S rRNA (adenine(1518)-N(6)/adenine(1519)-N(6))-dimethyltransferase RsmA [Limosilactobacillus fastidiosus]MCD7116944.1 16S rRNA (adenin
MSESTQIGNRKATRSIMNEYGIHAKKGFGQNFLTDPEILDRIVDAAEVTKKDNVIEIGPGIGALTEQLANAASQVVAVEIDQDLIPVLEKTLADHDNVTVINQDILKANLPELIQKQFTDPTKPIKVVANLPYYITSPILMGLLASPVEWTSITVMMQKEVAQRLTAKPGTKQYGALTLAIEYQMDAEIAFNVSRHSFIPAPNVDSAIVVLKQRQQPLTVKPFDKQKLMGFIRGCFAHRRKSLWNNLQSVIDKDAETKEKMIKVLEQLGLSPQIRPEKLTLSQFTELLNALHQENLI